MPSAGLGPQRSAASSPCSSGLLPPGRAWWPCQVDRPDLHLPAHLVRGGRDLRGNLGSGRRSTGATTHSVRAGGDPTKDVLDADEGTNLVSQGRCQGAVVNLYIAVDGLGNCLVLAPGCSAIGPCLGQQYAERFQAIGIVDESSSLARRRSGAMTRSAAAANSRRSSFSVTSVAIVPGTRLAGLIHRETRRLRHQVPRHRPAWPSAASPERWRAVPGSFGRSDRGGACPA